MRRFPLPGDIKASLHLPFADSKPDDLCQHSANLRRGWKAISVAAGREPQNRTNCAAALNAGSGTMVEATERTCLLEKTVRSLQARRGDGGWRTV
jgi:hypothetical protein